MRFLAALLAVCAFSLSGAEKNSSWEAIVRQRIPLYGHRNWIVIADSAYPAQSRDGIETVVTEADQLEAVRGVLAALARSKHVKPIVYTDQELKFLDDKDAPGISEYRRELEEALAGRAVTALPHEQIIGRLDQVSQTFKVLIIKTAMTLPYTSVFLQLDCAYWGPDAEKRLRVKMRGPGK